MEQTVVFKHLNMLSRFLKHIVSLFPTAILHSPAVGGLCSKWPGGGAQEPQSGSPSPQICKCGVCFLKTAANEGVCI